MGVYRDSSYERASSPFRQRSPPDCRRRAPPEYSRRAPPPEYYRPNRERFDRYNNLKDANGYSKKQYNYHESYCESTQDRPDEARRSRSRLRFPTDHSRSSSSSTSSSSSSSRSRSRTPSYPSTGITAAASAAGALLGHRIGKSSLGAAGGAAIGVVGARQFEKSRLKHRDRTRRNGNKDRVKDRTRTAGAAAAGFAAVVAAAKAWEKRAKRKADQEGSDSEGEGRGGMMDEIENHLRAIFDTGNRSRRR